MLQPLPVGLSRGFRWGVLGSVATLLLAIFWVYTPALRSDFVRFDDYLYIADNPRTQAGLSLAGARWAFTDTVAGHWAPLTLLSHQAASELFGLDPRGHHLINVVLHAIAALLLWAALFKLTGALGRSGVVAALFALHPSHVESVAWVSERKDVLGGVFFAATLLLYASYARRPSRGRFALVAAALAAGLMSKAMLVTTPLVLLLLDYWPLERAERGQAGARRWRGLVIEKLPLLVLSVLSSAVAIFSARHLLAPVEVAPWGARLGNAVVSAAKYLEITFWPRDLAVFYPFAVPSWQQVLAAIAVLGAVSVVVWASRRQRYLVTGWLWFLVMLLPVIGLIQSGSIARADRYTYLPAIGLYLMVVWGVGDALAAVRRPIRQAALAAAAIVVIALAAAARIQANYWKDSERLFRRAVEVTEGNYLAHHNLAQTLAAAGRAREAEVHFKDALAIAPGKAATHAAYAGALRVWRRPRESLRHFDQAVRLDPNDARAHLGRAIVLTDLGRAEEAIAELRRAVKLKPDLAPAHQGLGVLLSAQGDSEAAARHFLAAVEADPRLAPVLLPAVRALRSGTAPGAPIAHP